MDLSDIALPSSWCLTTVAESGMVVTGNTPLTSSEDNYGGNLPFVKPPHLVEKTIQTSNQFLTKKGAATARILPSDSVLVSCIGNLGKTGITRCEVAINQQINAIIPSLAIIPHYLFYQVQSAYFRQQLESRASATTISIVNKGNFETIRLTVAPIAEQRRIVAKIEELFSELDQGIETLKKARAQLAVYRQALLKHAFEGKLTADWRAAHAGPRESSDGLNARISKEREVRYQQELRAWNGRRDSDQLSEADEVITKPRKPKPPFRLAPGDVEKLTDLPATWNWMTFESLASPAQRSIQSGPFGSSLKHSEFTETGVLVIGIDNVQKGYFTKGSQNRISTKTYERLKKYSARPHDVLMTVMATVGRCCSVPPDLETAIITKHVYRMSPNLKLVVPSFLVNALIGCPATVKAIEKDKVGQTRPGINGEILKWLPIPLPPVEEQREIMQILTSNLESVDLLESDIDLNLQKAEALRQSILKKAFAGELVPQDPADEPASELLARIRAEREAAVASPRTARKVPRKTQSR